MSDSLVAEKTESLDMDIRRTGPDTLAGRYLRCFWQPIYHAADLPTGCAVPLRIMSEDFTLYRGESGKPYLIGGRCAHRGTRLSTGWIQGEEIRCFFHGWKFDGKGQCVEQPAEDSRFADRVSVGGHPVREYLGMFFAYLGGGTPPEFPRFKEFEFFNGLVELDSYLRECNYLQNLENALDMSHVGFVHSDNSGSFEGIGHGKRLKAEESDWGVRYSFLRPDGQERVQQFGMPNIFHPMALPTDPEVGWLESMFWWTPIDDERHMQFTIHRLPVTGEVAKRVEARKQARRSQIDLAHQDVADDVIDGRIRLADIDQSRVDLVRLQDDIAQVGQGRFGSSSEKLGRSDVGVVAIRRLWQREMAKMQRGEELKPWRHDASTMPAVWAVPELARSGEAAPSTVTDIRPFVEIKLQLRALHGEPRVR
jgi:5,5'-dehydrodivanillate O-demethylase